jgi:hypothetical protein
MQRMMQTPSVCGFKMREIPGKQSMASGETKATVQCLRSLCYAEAWRCARGNVKLVESTWDVAVESR